jgi:hypothetical protein
MNKTLRRGLAGLALAGLLVPGSGAATAASQDIREAYVPIDKAPRKAKVDTSETFAGLQFNGTRPLEVAPVGPLPPLLPDDEYGCDWSTAEQLQEEGKVPDGWIAVARREGTCFGFQDKLNAATAAGADGLVVVSNHRGVDVNGTAVAAIPAMLISFEDGDRLIKSIKMRKPQRIEITMTVNPE